MFHEKYFNLFFSFSVSVALVVKPVSSFYSVDFYIGIPEFSTHTHHKHSKDKIVSNTLKCLEDVVAPLFPGDVEWWVGSAAQPPSPLHR